MAARPKPFDRTTLERAFQRLGEIAVAEGKIVEISIYGGSALVLSMDYRVATRDVDAVFETDREFVRRAAEVIASEFGWNPDWINDGVKGFLSDRDKGHGTKRLFHTFPSERKPGLRVFVALPEYLFAMKCMAMRVGGVETNEDIEDIRQLGIVLDVKTLDEALSIVGKFYPRERLPPKTYLGLEEIFGTE